MGGFSLNYFFERHPALEAPTNLDAHFAAPERAGTLLELPANLPEAVVEEIRQSISDLAFNRYPVREGAALGADIAERLKLPPTHSVMLGNGALDLIDLVMQALAPAGTLLTLDPDFFMFWRSAKKHGLTVNSHALDADLTLDSAAFRRKLEDVDPDLLILSNPHNPTSVLFPLEEVANLVERAPGLVLLDEIYAPFAAEPDASLALLERHPNLMILRSFSKIGAAAVRLGYLIGHAQILERLSAWQRSFSVGSLSLLAGRAIVRHYPLIEAEVRSVTKARDSLIAQMRQLPGLSVLPSSTNFVVVRFPSGDVKSIHNRLRGNGIKTVVLSGNLALADCLRFAVDSQEQNNLTVKHLSEILLDS